MSKYQNAGNFEYVEATEKPWTSKYNHQKRPDIDARLMKVLPRDRLTTKRGSTFTTDVRGPQSNDQNNIRNKKKTKFVAKNEK